MAPLPCCPPDPVKTFALALMLTTALAADAVGEVHGSGDGFSVPGLAIAWGIERGASEATTAVVIRIAADRTKYPWLAVVGIDPFTKAEQVRQPATSVPDTLDVRIPRGQIADHPNTAFRFYAGEAAARANTPALVVYYHGVPDTAPEFKDAVLLDAHLTSRVAQLRNAKAKAP